MGVCRIGSRVAGGGQLAASVRFAATTMRSTPGRYFISRRNSGMGVVAGHALHRGATEIITGRAGPDAQRSRRRSRR